jgi:hypothetical protein
VTTAELRLKLKKLQDSQYFWIVPIASVLAVILLAMITLLLFQSRAKPSLTNLPLKPTPTPYVQKIWTVMVTREIFVPKSLTMKRNGTLNFLNLSQGLIDIEATGSSSPLLNLGAVPFGSIKSVVMPQPGTYQYLNQLNSKEKGIIIVQ